SIYLNHFRELTYLKSIGDGVIAIDRHWIVTRWNKAAAIITGWSEVEAVGQPLRNVFKIIKESSRRENISFIENAIVMGETMFMANNSLLIRKDKTEIPVGDSAAPIFSANNAITGAIIVFRDMSKEREVRLLQSDFAYASHQLRTPVNKALWYTEVLMEDVRAKPILQELGIAHLSMQSTAKIIGKLMTISDIDRGNIILKFSQANLNKIIQEIKISLKQELTEKKIAFKAINQSEYRIIKTDPKKLKAALWEIMNNAVRYNKPDGKIDLRISSNKQGILFTVSDTGIGISIKEQPLIFTKFFRGGNIDVTKIIGAGLGLYIAREYIKLLGGKIWFESKKNKGTTFYLLMPLENNRVKKS
ncbi:MAG TPA: ATP-binding protein, partial [Patescibacteria group bacterium]